jgi:glucose dehydrogenase
MLRNGIMPTKAGLVFIAGNDGKLRAYDEDTGKELWSGPLPGPSRGVPVMYESKGRQFLAVAATPGGAQLFGAPQVQSPVVPPDTPRGLIAFAVRR